MRRQPQSHDLRRHPVALLLVACCGLLLAEPAFAQHYPGPYSQPRYYSAQRPASRNPPSYPPTYPRASHHAVGRSSFGVRLLGEAMKDDKLHLGDVDEHPWLGGIGLQMRNRLSSHISLEVALDYVTGQSNPGTVVLAAGDSKTLPDTFRQTSVPLSVSLLGHLFRDAVLDPYVLAGVGVQWTSLDYADSVFQTSLTETFGQLGVGIQLWLGRRAAVHVDLRSLAVLQNFGATTDLVAECRNTSYCTGTDRVPKPEDKVNFGLQGTAGLTFYLP